MGKKRKEIFSLFLEIKKILKLILRYKCLYKNKFIPSRVTCLEMLTEKTQKCNWVGVNIFLGRNNIPKSSNYRTGKAIQFLKYSKPYL